MNNVSQVISSCATWEELARRIHRWSVIASDAKSCPRRYRLCESRGPAGRGHHIEDWLRADTGTPCGTTRNCEMPTNKHDALNGVDQANGSFMTFTKVILSLACLATGLLVAQGAKATQLLLKELTNPPSKVGVMITEEYTPVSSDPLHRATGHACT